MKETILKVLKKMRTDYGNNENIIFAQDSDLDVVVDEILVAINVIQCCMGEAEQLPIARCGCEEPDPTEIKVCVQCDGYVE